MLNNCKDKWRKGRHFLQQSWNKGAPSLLISIKSFNLRQLILKRKTLRFRSFTKAGWLRGTLSGWNIEEKLFLLISSSAHPENRKLEGSRFILSALICRADNYSSLLIANLHCFDSVYSGKEVL